MTTIPSRIDRIGPALESVLGQTVPVEHIELNVPYVCVRTNEPYTLPTWLTEMERVRVFRTDDYGPITKIAPTLLRHKDDQETYLWSVDDDFAYPENQLAMLCRGHRTSEYRILARHGGDFNADGSITFKFGQTQVSMFEGFGTVLYPPACIGDDFQEYLQATSKDVDCRESDDVVLSLYFSSRRLPIFIWNSPSETEPFYPTGSLPHSSERDAIHLQSGGNLERYKRVLGVLRWRGFTKPQPNAMLDIVTKQQFETRPWTYTAYEQETTAHEQATRIGMINLAINKPAIQSSTSEWSFSQLPEEDARGGNDGRISSEMGFHTQREQDPWWQVDLEGEFLVHRVVIYNRQHQAHRLKHFSLLRSLDGQHWSVFYRKIDSTTFGESDAYPYVANISGDQPARFVRVRLDGYECLHFSECQVFGAALDQETRERIIANEALAERNSIPEGRNGYIENVGGFRIFVDNRNYTPHIIKALSGNYYEGRERQLTAELVYPSDRVIEVGTAIGIVTMTAALIVGAENVLTFDANPDIVEDARQNFARNGLSGILSRNGVLRNRRKIFKRDDTVEFYIDKDFWASRLDALSTAPGIIKTVQIPIYCLEDEIRSHAANVLICDIEGGETELLMEADLTGIRLIIMETHYAVSGEAATDAMMRKLIVEGFSIHLAHSGGQFVVLRR
nr:FkbM family methyltransferase [Mesorhizobium loti]